MERIKVAMPTKMLAEVKRRARAEGNPTAAWIRRAIAERLERERKR